MLALHLTVSVRQRHIKTKTNALGARRCHPHSLFWLIEEGSREFGISISSPDDSSPDDSGPDDSSPDVSN